MQINLSQNVCFNFLTACYQLVIVSHLFNMHVFFSSVFVSVQHACQWMYQGSSRSETMTMIFNQLQCKMAEEEKNKLLQKPTKQ